MTSNDHVTVSIRKATQSDSGFVLDIRNSPEVRRWAFTGDMIDEDTHCIWFADALRRNDRHIFIVEAGGIPAGVVRADITGASEAEIHISLSREWAGRGVGVSAIRSACQCMRDTAGIIKFIANIKPDNAASVRAFEKAGFEMVYICMQKDMTD